MGLLQKAAGRKEAVKRTGLLSRAESLAREHTADSGGAEKKKSPPRMSSR